MTTEAMAAQAALCRSRLALRSVARAVRLRLRRALRLLAKVEEAPKRPLPFYGYLPLQMALAGRPTLQVASPSPQGALDQQMLQRCHFGSRPKMAGFLR